MVYSQNAISLHEPGVVKLKYWHCGIELKELDKYIYIYCLNITRPLKQFGSAHLNARDSYGKGSQHQGL